MSYTYAYRQITYADEKRADVYTARFPSDSLIFKNIITQDKRIRMRNAAHLRYVKALERGEPAPEIVAWACLEQDVPAAQIFPEIETITDTGEYLISANSWITYVLRSLLSRGWLHWRENLWEISTPGAEPQWRQRAEAVLTWLSDEQRLWFERGPEDKRQSTDFAGFIPALNLIPVGRCGFVRDFVLSESSRMAFNTAFFLLEHDDFISHHSALGDPYGLCVEDGHVIRPPLYRRAAIWHTPNIRWQTGWISMEDVILILPDGTRLSPINADEPSAHRFHLNPIGESEIALYTRYFGVQSQGAVLGYTPVVPGRLELTIIDCQIVGWKRGGGLLIPQNGCVLSFAPTALTDDQWQAILACPQVSYVFSALEMQEMDRAVQCGPMLIQEGQNVLNSASLQEEQFWVSRYENDEYHVGVVPSDYPNDVDQSRAGRIGLGINAVGDLLVVAMPRIGRSAVQAPADSAGATLQELTEKLMTAGAVEAINLDGGGSTQLFVEGGFLTRPGDQRSYQHVAFERMVPAIGVVI